MSLFDARNLLDVGKYLFTSVASAYYDLLLDIFAWGFLLVLRTCRKLGWPLQIEERFTLKHIKAPRPISRKRALTLPIPPSSKLWKRQVTSSQDKCGLLKLPVELRLQIYQEFIIETNPKICMDLPQYLYEPMFAVWKGRHETIDDFLSLAMTCRQIYSESINLIYGTPIYAFSTTGAFLCFVSSILPQRCAEIRRVWFDWSEISSLNSSDCHNGRLDYSRIRAQTSIRSWLPSIPQQDTPTFWDAACKVLENMESLRSVIVIMNVKAFPTWEYGDEDGLVLQMLEYMKPLKGKKRDFELLLLAVRTRDTWQHYGGRTRWEAAGTQIITGKNFLVSESGVMKEISPS